MNQAKIKNWLQFLTVGIWRVTDEEATPLQHRIYACIKIVLLSIRQFTADRIPVRASALTYSTLLSIIPILALLFAIARGLGFDALMENQFRTSVTQQQAELIITWVNSYLEHAQSGIFIGVGLIMLLWTVLILTDNIERSFNAIWQVKHPRTVFRKITDYFSMLLLLPLLIVISSGLTIFMTTYVKQMDNYLLLGPVLKFLVRMIPYTLTWGMFIGLFVFIPNTKVRLSHAILPGILAGSAFQAFQYFYINSQIWVSNYNAIYGSFAAIPMFLLWTQISWTICLLGAEMSYISQNLDAFSFDKETENISRRYHDFFCTIILAAICKRFEQIQVPYTAEELSREHRIPIRLTKRILYELQDMHLIYEAVSDEKGRDITYIPGVDINRLTVGMLLTKLDMNGSEDFKIDNALYPDSWKVLVKARKEFTEQNNRILLKDL
ncbi:MAG: YihY/virulence factor BrkB family protein [Bacteroides sp.]|nr:YihY/virulence factor BrkB family protein [Bacteroides sp.]